MNQADDEGTAPLFMAAQEGHLPVVQLLLDREAAVNQAHDDGATPLIIAAQNSLISVVQLLLKHEVSDDMHSEARETAYNQGHAAVVAALWLIVLRVSQVTSATMFRPTDGTIRPTPLHELTTLNDAHRDGT